MKNKVTSKSKGFIKERLVAQYLKKRAWTILYQNKKILGVEIDILARKNKDIRLIEVKSIKKEEHLEKLLKAKQKQRLQKAAQSLFEDFPEGLRLFLATVDSQNKIHFFEIDN